MSKERDAFNFYRSYYEVYSELSLKDKVLFMDALLNRQFNGVEPKDLEGMPRFAYLSQKHSIDRQVKGWEDKMKKALYTPNQDPCQGGTEGGTEGGCQQGEEKGEEKGKGQKDKGVRVDYKKFLNWFNDMHLKHRNVRGKWAVLSDTDKNNLKKLKEQDYTPQDWESAFVSMLQSEWVQENKTWTPQHFLRNESFQKYLNDYTPKTFKAAWE